jgi:hypothetical protein
MSHLLMITIRTKVATTNDGSPGSRPTIRPNDGRRLLAVPIIDDD